MVEHLHVHVGDMLFSFGVLESLNNKVCFVFLSQLVVRGSYVRSFYSR